MAYGLARGRVREVKRTMRQLVKAGTKRISEAELRKISIPATLIWGRHDRMVPLRIADALNAKLGWPLHVIEDAGHVPHIEQRDAFLRSLRTAISGGTVGGTSTGSRGGRSGR